MQKLNNRNKNVSGADFTPFQVSSTENKRVSNAKNKRVSSAENK